MWPFIIDLTVSCKLRHPIWGTMYCRRSSLKACTRPAVKRHKTTFDPIACKLASADAGIQGPRCTSPAIPVSQLTPGIQKQICRQEGHSTGHVCYLCTPQRLSTWKHESSRSMHIQWHLFNPTFPVHLLPKAKSWPFASFPLSWFITIISPGTRLSQNDDDPESVSSFQSVWIRNGNGNLANDLWISNPLL